jgi:hypothetical protein
MSGCVLKHPKLIARIPIVKPGGWSRAYLKKNAVAATQRRLVQMK